MPSSDATVMGSGVVRFDRAVRTAQPTRTSAECAVETAAQCRSPSANHASHVLQLFHVSTSFFELLGERPNEILMGF